MSHSLCQICYERPANVFVTKVEHGHTQKQRLCEQCAKERAAADGFFDDLPDEVAQAFTGNSLDEIVGNLIDHHLTADDWENEDPFAGSDFTVGDFNSGEFPGDEDLADEIDEVGDEEEEIGLEHPPLWPDSKPISATRCPRCETTWDRLRQDGRAGCPHCYSVFGEELQQVMERLQRGEVHIGKRPRAADKRRRRLEHLRVQRDNRLAMLQKRLREAVAAENYEEAAQLRDKIKVVTSTIVDVGS